MRKMLSVLAAATLVSSFPISAFAKEEIVYVDLNGSGNTESTDVVNKFNNIKPDEIIIDFGKYINVNNMTPVASIENQDGKVAIKSSEDGNVYYDGQLADSQLPWNVEVKYYLDGVEKSASEIAGSTGKFRMTIKVTKNSKYNGPDFYKNYALQSSIEFDSNKVTDIKSQDATIANAGQKKKLTYIALPNKGANYEITANVTDFETDGLSINALPLNLNVEVDDSELQAKVHALQNAIASLDDGANTLDNGSKELVSGSRQIASALNQLAEKSSALTNGSGEFYKGLKTVQTALNNSDLASKIAEIKDSLTYANYSASIEAILKQGGLLPTTASLEDFVAGDIKAQAILNVTEIYYGLLNQTINAKINTVLLPKLAELKSGIDKIVGSYEQINSGISEYTNGVKAVNTGYQQLMNGTLTLSSGINTLSNGTNTFRRETANLDKTVSDKIDNLISSIKGEANIGSYVSSENENVEAVQFVIKTAKIEKPVVKQEKKEEKSENQSFFDKLFSLFKF